MQFVPTDLRMEMTLSGNSSPFMFLPNLTVLQFSLSFNPAIKLNCQTRVDDTIWV